MAAEEADVDIEGDVVAAAAQPGSNENTVSVLQQDHYLDSSWKTDNGLIPWTLDSTISEENRAVIEKMLLEEEYYLSKKSLREKFWLDQKENEKKCMKSLQKTGKIMVHSPTKPASYSVKWTIEEKELFEQGLAKFGRRWTKIAKLIGSRTVLQVKSYARQYFKNKVKLDGLEKETPNQKSNSDLQVKNEDEGTKPWTPSPSGLRGLADPNLNAVKIEKLSDDEEVDITDEAEELPAQAPEKNPSSGLLLDIPDSKIHETNQGEFIASDTEKESFSKSSKESLQNIKQGEAEILSSSVITLQTEKQSTSDKKSFDLHNQKCNELIKNCDKHCENGIRDGAGQLPFPEPWEAQKDLSDKEMLFHSSCQIKEENHEEEELKPPEQEVEIDRNTIQEEEKQAIPEFFEGRQAKTPERYLKIRNYILDQWLRQDAGIFGYAKFLLCIVSTFFFF